MRSEGVHLHSVTNTVAQNFTANVLLACGATVSMTANPEEIGDFVAKAAAVHVNLGTLDRNRMAAIGSLADLAHRGNKPVLLDPVKVDISSQRLSFARSLVPLATIVKGNRAEMAALDLTPGKACCLVETGPEDRIRSGEYSIAVLNGHPMMDRVIATGCALGALMAALSAVSSSPMIASLAALVWFSVAGEVAAEKGSGPGSFNQRFLDTLFEIAPETLCERARLA